MTLTSEKTHLDAQRLAPHLRLATDPAAAESSVIRGDRYRFTVLTSRMIRMEYNEDGSFEDRASQMALNRRLDQPEFRVIDEAGHLQILTEHLHLTYDKKPFSPNGLTIQVRGNLSAYHSLWRYSETGENLGGTARTLDNANGAVPLEPGLMSRNGYAVLDDSASLLLEDDGWFSPRPGQGQDLYFFGYGRSYRDCLQDFYHLTGNTPMIPRFALGNWWSRYYRYTAAEYKELITRFKTEDIPFSVAVLDMDWHHVDIDPKYGSGWTGYTWNTDLFPDPDQFTHWLHENGLRLTLNVHPADGVRAHEDAYAAAARTVGLDPAEEHPIVFDVTDPEFLKAYFEELHHPLEDRGVDFWWLDWQSGSHSKVPGLDPLWVLNHLHFLDSARDGKRPLTFSRYAGPGSHRYPVGFSGDTIVTWESLDFQPYFTATASNIGYGWWSHDIGGHMGGYKDDDLAVRWTQFGVFSPLMRLHSSASPFTGKEPWRFRTGAGEIMKDYLRLRHRLVPYLHTMNHRASHDGLPLIQPMYYEHPDNQAAYEVPNQYLFGTQLMICPITSPQNTALNLGKTKAWLPEGTWIDFFTGLIYRGDRTMYLYRRPEHIPALAPAGAIIPLTERSEASNGTANPTSLELRIFAGASGSFDLIEDDETEETSSRKPARTSMELDWEAGTFTVHPAVGHTSALPAQRNYDLSFTGFAAPENVAGTSSGRPMKYTLTTNHATNTTTISVENVATEDGLQLTFESGMNLAMNNAPTRALELLTDAQIDFHLKDSIFKKIQECPDPALLISHLQSMDLESDLMGALTEIFLA